jgi:hypothetical protein
MTRNIITIQQQSTLTVDLCLANPTIGRDKERLWKIVMKLAKKQMIKVIFHRQ